MSTTVVGVAYSLLHSALSAFSGVYTELLLKQGGAQSQPLALQQLMLYLWGFVLNLLVVSLRGFALPHPWTALESSLVLSQVASGMLMGWLMRYQSNIAKVFIHSLTSICVAFMQWIMWYVHVRLCWCWGVCFCALAHC
jgi:hypothetical protein